MDTSTVIQTLRTHRAVLEHTGVERLYLFGSMARRDGDQASDVDFVAACSVAAKKDPRRRLRVIAQIADLLGTYAFDLADLDKLRPDVRAGFERDQVTVF